MVRVSKHEKVRLDRVTFDAGTQVRAGLDHDHVDSLAEAMTNGAAIPPIVLFHDGNRYYIGDGFHRYMAAQRLDWRDIAAEIKAGAREDALWFALGANRDQHALKMTGDDKKHAILLALQAWPDRSINQIAEQIGVNQRYASGIRAEVSATTNLPERVTGKDGKSYPARHARQAIARDSSDDDIKELGWSDPLAGAERVHDISDAEAESLVTLRQIKKLCRRLTKQDRRTFKEWVNASL